MYIQTWPGICAFSKNLRVILRILKFQTPPKTCSGPLGFPWQVGKGVGKNEGVRNSWPRSLPAAMQM
jgi:hypothetical protein